MRRLLTALVIAVATLPVPVHAASVPVLVVDGRGYGHGVGMAQDGAYWMGRAGARVDAILGHFYPGTVPGRGDGDVRVVVQDVGPAPASVVVGFPDGGEIRDAPGGAQSSGFPVQVERGARVRLVWDGSRYRVERVDAAVALGPAAPVSHVRHQVHLPTSTTAPPSPAPPPSSTSTTSTTARLLPPRTTTTTTPPADEPRPEEPAEPRPAPEAGKAPSSNRPLWAVPTGNGTVELPSRQRRYRGLVEATGAAGRLRVVNQVDVETYLKGMGEVRDPAWPPAALQAQAVAARTYALRAMLGGGEICDTQRCQVYLGAQAEYAAMNRAVDDTRGRVLVYGRSLASAVYSANGGGHSASREEGFGVVAGDAPYLRPAPYTTGNPLPWTVTVALHDVAARLGYRGTVTDVRVSRSGPSGRVLEVTLDGDAGSRTVSGIAFDAALGLRSTLFTLRVDTADVAPPPPPAESLVQAPPDVAAAPAAAGAAMADPVVASVEAAPRSVPRPAGPRPERSTEELAAVFAAWAVLAVGGGTVLARSGRHAREA